MKRSFEQVDVKSSGDSSSSSSSGPDLAINTEEFCKQSPIDISSQKPAQELTPDALLIKRAKMYQEYMKQLPIPREHGSIIPCKTWMDLGISLKDLYGQPLHYLTNVLLKQWDKMRIGAEDECAPLDTIIHPCKAEATVWLIEEAHRRTSSHHHIAKLWLSDPMYASFLDSTCPQL